MHKKRRIAIFINIICCIAVLFMSSGYSSFSKKVTADEISATIRIEKEIRVNKISLSNTSNGAISSWEEYNYDNIEGRIILPSETSEIIYTVDILNLSNKEYGILSLTGLSEELEYELIDYNLEEKICVESKCTLGVTKPINIKIKYKEGMFNSSNTEYNFKLNFDFRTYHSVNYVDIPSTGLPIEIIDGGVFNQTIIPTVSKGIEVRSGDLILTKDVDYTYNDNKLVINKTNDNITITNIKYQVGDYIKLNTEGFYVISADESADTLTMLAEWNLNVGANPVSGLAGMQNSQCIGFPSKNCLIAFSSINYWSSTATSYPAWVYNDQSELFIHVENYINELKKLGYSSVTGRLIKQEELVSLGCSTVGGYGACNSAPIWVYNTSFWTGSAGRGNNVWRVGADRYFDDNYACSYNKNSGVRPIITIPVSEI